MTFFFGGNITLPYLSKRHTLSVPEESESTANAKFIFMGLKIV
jgi:hypothetical protein